MAINNLGEEEEDMSDFIKTGDPVDTYATPGTPCAACTCQDFLLCDNWKYAAAAGSSNGIQNNNWRHPGIGDEYN